MVKRWYERIVASSGNPDHELQGMNPYQLADIAKQHSDALQGFDWTGLDAFLADGNSWGEACGFEETTSWEGGR